MSDPYLDARKFHFLEAFLLAIAFALAYTQSPLYYSNQNQYFLHGLAQAGEGYLSHDWLANTRDPTPLFSACVNIGDSTLGAWVFQSAYFLMLMGYFLSVRFLIAALPLFPNTLPFRLAFAAGFTASHAAILRIASVQLLHGVDFPWYFQAGVAGQYLLGPGLQPSAFGLLLMSALAAFASGKTTLAAFLAALPCIIHSTYLLPAGLLIIGFIIETFRINPNAGPIGFRMLIAASLCMAPVFAYTLFTFGPTNPKVFEESQHILAEIRIPHHCVVARWFDAIAGLQLAWVGIGLALLRKTPLFVALLIPTVLAALLSLVQYLTANPTLALLFPWRISAVLVPLATAMVVANLASFFSKARRVSWIAGGIVLLLADAGILIMVEGLGYRTGEDEQPLYEYVRAHRRPEDVYLLPIRIPAVGTGRGSMSASFTPPPRPKPGSNLIPIDLQRFRLLTGAPIYIDFKAVPYADVEVLIWLQRVHQCESWYAEDWSSGVMEDELKREGITHIVAPAGKPIAAKYLEQVHADAAYVVYRLK